MSNVQRRWYFISRLVVQFVGACSGVFVTSCFGAAGANDNWSRTVVDRMPPGIPFAILTITSIDGHITAGCGYQYRDGERALVFRGTKHSGNEFSPLVNYEVATEGLDSWKTVGKSLEAKNPEMLTFSVTNSRGLFDIDLDPFRSSIGKYRWGRVVLENGDSAIIEIDNLLPPGDSPAAASGSFKQNLVDLDPRRFGSSFALISIVSLPKQLIGNFVYIAGSEGSFVEIKGTQSSDGDFWPSVTLEVSNLGKDWQTIEKLAQNPNVVELKIFHTNPLKTLRVSLAPYKPLSDKFRYGKIVFSDGNFAIFELANLKPASRRSP